MAKLSKRIMNKELEERMFEVFWKSIADLKSPQEAEKFFKDLLSPTEEVMLAKRLAIAILLAKGYSYPTIDRTLKVSTTTIMNVNLWLKHGGEGYKRVIERVLTKEGEGEFWDNLEEKLEKLFPPRYGTDWHRSRQKSYLARLKRRQKRSLL